MRNFSYLCSVKLLNALRIMEQSINRIGLMISPAKEYDEKGLSVYEPKGNIQSIDNLADYKCTADELRRRHRAASC